MDDGNWKPVIYCRVYSECIPQNIRKQAIITLQPAAAAFIHTQVYFNHRVCAAFAISRQINYSALTRGEKRKLPQRAVIFSSITKGKYLLFISTCLIWA